MLRLQRTIGNQATQRFLAARAGASHPAQAARPPTVAPQGSPAPRGSAASSGSAVDVQRCGGETHAGCACAGETSAKNDDAGGLDVQLAPAGPTAAAAPLLTSPRFAGDTTLEACRQDKARLGVGARGEPVRKVQQALLDLGMNLGETGADTVYGPATSNAVKAFKKKEQLGSEQFGDVGPGTMRRLDELFPAERPAPPDNDVPEADEEDATGCPAPDAVVEAVESSQPVKQALVQNITAAPSVTAPPVVTDPIQRAIESFKQKANIRSASGALEGSPNMTDAGQFVFATRLRDAIELVVRRIDAVGDRDAKAYATAARLAMNTAMSRKKEVDAHIKTCVGIADATSSSAKIDMLVLLKKAGSGGSIDAALFAALEASATDQLPATELLPFRSLRALKAIAAFDATACGGHALRLAQRVLRKGGLVPRKVKGASMAAVLASGAGFNDMRPMANLSSTREPTATRAVTAGATELLGDVIDQAGASSAAAQMRKALSDGKLIHARVVSGEGYGAPGTSVGKIDPITKKRVDEPASITAKRHAIGKAPEEHSLLIIGFDGDKFVFHDPDASVSSGAGGGPGFGLLFFDAVENRLSTAKSPADMLVDEKGKHNAGQHGAHDKRYQVISLTSV